MVLNYVDYYSMISDYVCYPRDAFYVFFGLSGGGNWVVEVSNFVWLLHRNIGIYFQIINYFYYELIDIHTSTHAFSNHLPKSYFFFFYH
jgi:hypothetical protein